MAEPTKILDLALKDAEKNIKTPFITDQDIMNRLDYICRVSSNKSGIRVLLAASLAKVSNPKYDIRKPYTEIKDENVYSGRVYDEKYITRFIIDNDLPCNSTTAWLTPAWRNLKDTLTLDTDLVGTPRRMYSDVIQALNDVHSGKISADNLLKEIIRQLLILRNTRQMEFEQLLKELKDTKGEYEIVFPLSTEDVITLIEQHLSSKGSSRLPVLVVAAAYNSAKEYLRESVLPLEAHNAADKQTGSLGDLEIILNDAENIVTSYEMKDKRVTKNDIDFALGKIREGGFPIDNYIFITTEEIDDEVLDYARSIYEKTRGIEITVLDCISFIRYFLHLFTRLRSHFLDEYQNLVLCEPDSAVSKSLKQAFLNLRINAQSSFHRE